MAYDKPKVTIDLEEYEELQAKAEKYENGIERPLHAYKVVVAELLNQINGKAHDYLTEIRGKGVHLIVTDYWESNRKMCADDIIIKIDEKP